MIIDKNFLNKIATAKRTETEQAVLEAAELAVKNLLPQLLKKAKQEKLSYQLKSHHIPYLTKSPVTTPDICYSIMRTIGKILGSAPYKFSVTLEQTSLQDVILDTVLIISWEN